MGRSLCSTVSIETNHGKPAPTAARWSLTGAETVLRLRALRSRDDFDAYWDFTNNRNTNVTTRRTTPITAHRRPSRPQLSYPSPAVAAP
jgi:hypothetical protein